MPTHAETRVVPYTADEMYALIADVARYPEFLPWCAAARIRGTRPLNDGDKIQLGRTTILRFTYHDRLDESFQKQMFDSALRDGLTGAYNKRYFLDRLESELKFALRHRTPLSLLMLDLDHFKRVNDTHGHPVGDRVLKAFADTIHRSIRNEDVFARYGGEEFAIISRATPLARASVLGERLRRATSALAVDGGGAASR